MSDSTSAKNEAMGEPSSAYILGEVEANGSTWRLHVGGNTIDWVSPPEVLSNFIAELFTSAPQDILTWVHSAAWRLREESWQGGRLPQIRESSNRTTQVSFAKEVHPGSSHWHRQSQSDTWERGVPSENDYNGSGLQVKSLALRAQSNLPQDAMRTRLRTQCYPLLGGLVDESTSVTLISGESLSPNEEIHESHNGIVDSTVSLLKGMPPKCNFNNSSTLVSMPSTNSSKKTARTGGSHYELYEASTTETGNASLQKGDEVRKTSTSTQIAALADGRMQSIRKIPRFTNESQGITTDARLFLNNFNAFTLGLNRQRSSLSNALGRDPSVDRSWAGLSPITWKSFAWTGLFALCLLCELWVVPLQVIFFRNGLPNWTRASDVFFFIFFTLDIGMSSITGYLSEGVLHTSWPSSSFRYMRRWLWIDVGSTLPYIFCIASNTNQTSLRWIMVFRMLRLHRVRKWLGMFPFFIPWRPAMPLMLLTILLLCFVQSFTVIYALLQPAEWIETHPEGPYGCYLQCLRWSFVAITLGDTPHTGDRFCQTIWDLLVSVSRVFFLLFILEWTKTHSLVQGRRSGRSQGGEAAMDEDRLSSYLRSRGIPPHLQIEIMHALGEVEETKRDQAGRTWVTSQIIDNQLRQELKQCLWETKLGTLGIMLPLIQWHSSFAAELAAFVDEVVHPPGAVLVTCGDPPVSAYFIISGRISVGTILGADPIPDYTKWMWVCEHALLNPEWLAKETLYCRSRAELMVVRAEHFHALIAEHSLGPAYQTFLQETLWMGFCGRCGLFGDHFSNNCPSLEESRWETMITRVNELMSGKKSKSFKYKNELLKLLSDHGLANMAAELHRYGIKNVNDLNTAAFDDFLDDEDTGILRQDKEKLRTMVEKFKKKHVEGTAALLNTTAAADHIIFISHYKAEAGTEATLMQRDLEGLILKKRINPGIVSPVFVDSENLKNLEDLKSSVLRSYNVVVLLTPDVLTRPWVLVEISFAFANEVNIIPVEVQRPNLKFTFPDEAHLKGIGTGEKLNEECRTLLEQEGVVLSDLEAALRHLFKFIAMPYSPHKSNSIREAELQDVIGRCVLKRPRHAMNVAPAVSPCHSTLMQPYSSLPIRKITTALSPKKIGRGENGVENGHMSLAATQAMDRVRVQRKSNFKEGDRVIVTKESRTKGRLATVSDPNWHGIIKVEMDTEDEKGRTKTFKPGELAHIDESAESGGLSSTDGIVFRPGDRVRVIKESRTKGKTAVVAEPHWHGLVKVTMDVPDEKGATKSFKTADLELI